MNLVFAPPVDGVSCTLRSRGVRLLFAASAAAGGTLLGVSVLAIAVLLQRYGRPATVAVVLLIAVAWLSDLHGGVAPPQIRRQVDRSRTNGPLWRAALHYGLALGSAVTIYISRPTFWAWTLTVVLAGMEGQVSNRAIVAVFALFGLARGVMPSTAQLYRRARASVDSASISAVLVRTRRRTRLVVSGYAFLLVTSAGLLVR